MQNVIEVAGRSVVRIAADAPCAPRTRRTSRAAGWRWAWCSLLPLALLGALAQPAGAQRARGARGVPGAPSVDGRAARTCRDGGWSAAHDVRAPNGDYLYVERPAIVPIGDATAFIGQTLAYDSTGRPVATWGHGPDRIPDSLPDFAAGVLRDRDGRYTPLRHPPGAQRRMELSRAVRVGRGALVLWGVVLDTTAPLGVVQEIQVATLDSTGWSVPQRIVARPWIRWFRPGVDVTRAPDGAIHAVVSMDVMGGGGVLHFSNASGRWRVDSTVWFRGEPRMYPQLEVLDADRYLLVMQGGATEQPRGGSSRLFAARSDDGGATWSEPVPVSTRAMEDAYEPRLFRLHDTLGVAWRQGLPSRGPFGDPGSGESDSIRLSLSRDGGRTWRAEPPLVAPYGLSDFELLAADHGVLVAGHSVGAPARPTATWRAGAWHSLGSPQTAADFTAPNLGRTADGRIVMSWGRWFAHRRSVMRVSLLAPACAP